MNFSIRLRLVGALLLTIAALSIAASIATYLQARSSVNALFDYEIHQMTLMLSMHISAHPNLAEEPLLQVERDFVTQVWGRQQQLLLSSRPGQGPDRIMPEGFSDFGERGSGWRTFTSGAGAYVLQIAQPQSLRQKMAAEIAFKAVVPVLSIIPVGGLIVWLVIGYGLRPLRMIAQEVESRDLTSLRLIEAPRLPSEIAPLVTSLNHLLSRLERALKAEREFIADASHELRTPVAALNLQLNLLETASTPHERDEAMSDLKQGIARMRRLIEQILTLARLDPERREESVPINLKTLIADIHGDYARIAATKSIEFRTVEDERVTIMADTQSLEALTRSVLDNAMRYTPVGGAVTVQIGNAAVGPHLRISDSGPGIPPQIRDKVFSRFYRADHASDDAGTGLGLAIAQRAAERIGASIRLEDGPDGKGLTVLILFTRAPSPAPQKIEKIPCQ